MYIIKHRIHLSLFAAGVMLSLFSFLAVHHISSTLPQWEIAAFIFNLAYFAGVSLGYSVASEKTRAKLNWLLPLALLGQATCLALLRPSYFLMANAEFIGPRIAGWGVFFILLILGTPMFAVVLPQSIRTDGLTLRKAYSIEIMGSLFGLILIPVLGQFSHNVLIAVYTFFFSILTWSLSTKWLSRGAVIMISILWVCTFQVLDARLSTWYYQQKYPEKHILSVLETIYTPYHKIEMLTLENDLKMLILNGKRQFAEGSHHVYSYYVAELPAHLVGQNPKTLVLGCGSMSTVGRVGNLASSIHIVDIDPEVFNTSRKYFQEYNHLDTLQNWSFEADDAKHFLANDNNSYDLILHDIPPARSRQTALTYTKEFFELVKLRLKSGGIFSISALNSRSDEQLYGKKIIATLASVFEDIVVVLYGDSYYIYVGNDLSHLGYDRVLQATTQYISPEDQKKWFTKMADVWLKEDVLRETQGLKPITINNTGELIFD